MTSVSYRNVFLLTLVVLLPVLASGDCLNGCSSKGVCVDNACVCVDGLTGDDCSQYVFSAGPTLYDCPDCYSITVGPAVAYSGPSWRLPDGPIAALNVNGTLKVFQSNGYYEMVAMGTNAEQYLPSTRTAMAAGLDFDSCGAWLMRAFVDDTNTVQGFYHAETNCQYGNNGQTRKSAGYSESNDGGNSFSKPSYPSNKLVDTNAPMLHGTPTGEGDYGLVVYGDYYYMLFSNVEKNEIGVARSHRSDRGLPGTWYKYYNGTWTELGVGGLSSPLSNIAGTQLYHHIPTRSLLTVGQYSYYGSTGIAFSASTDGVNWAYLADPVVSFDPSNSGETIMYQSLLGSAGGDSVGNTFDLYYMYIPPGGTWTRRYQVRRQITISKAEPGMPLTKAALTAYRNRQTGEIWENREMMEFPYKATGIVGYIMTRPYPNSIQIYDCFNATTGDHFVAVGEECLFSSGLSVTRSLGHIYASRSAPHNLALYRCQNGTDLFVSTDSTCGGFTVVKQLGYVLDGPAISSDLLARDVLIAQGDSWKYVATVPAADWTTNAYNDSAWEVASAPFTTGYGFTAATPFGPSDYYFRKSFVVHTDVSMVDELLLSIASDDHAEVYINNVAVDFDIVRWHEAGYWNRKIYVNKTILHATGAENVMSVVVRNGDQWAFFDAQLEIKYSTSLYVQPAAPAHCKTCVNGQCVDGVCVCDAKWSGEACNISQCTFSDFETQNAIPRGSTWVNTQWVYIPSTPVGWIYPSYDDSWMHVDSAPFGTSPSYSGVVTWVPAVRHIYKQEFNVSSIHGKEVLHLTLRVASDDMHLVWINGVLVNGEKSSHTYRPHNASYWNTIADISSYLTYGQNTIAVEVPFIDATRTAAFFDLQLDVTYAAIFCATPTPTLASTPTPTPTPTPTHTPTTVPTTRAPTATPTPTTPTAIPTTRTPTATPTTRTPTTPVTTAPTATPTTAAPKTVIPTTTTAPTASTPAPTMSASCRATIKLVPRSVVGWHQDDLLFNIYDMDIQNTGVCPIHTITARVNTVPGSTMTNYWNYTPSTGVVSLSRDLAPNAVYTSAGIIMGGKTSAVPTASVSVTCKC